MMGDFKETGFIILSSPIKIPDHLFHNHVNVNGPKKWLKNNFDLFASNTTEYSNSNANSNILVIELENKLLARFLGPGILGASFSQSYAAWLMLNILRINIISSLI